MNTAVAALGGLWLLLCSKDKHRIGNFFVHNVKDKICQNEVFVTYCISKSAKNVYLKLHILLW